MNSGNIYASELSTSRHSFMNYHFCRGNSNKRKTRLGIILKGGGTYIYLGRRLKVKEGDLVFIPENIYCYSEWRGEPEIEVVYVSCFMHYDGFEYAPQTVDCDEWVKDTVLKISELLSGGFADGLEAYSLLYEVFKTILPDMKQNAIAFDKTLQNAIEYVTKNWNKDFSVKDIARNCCTSESTIYHLFKNELGQTPIHFLNSIRINVAMEYLENTSYSIATVSKMACFNSENHFRKVFFDAVGTTPMKFRKKEN